MWNLAKRWTRGRREVPAKQVRRTIAPEQLESRRLMAADALHVGLVYLETDYLQSAQDEAGDMLADRFLLSFTGGAEGSELTELQVSTDKDRDGLSVGDLIFDTVGGGRGKGGSHPFRVIKITSANPNATVTGTVDDGGHLLTLRFTNFRAGDLVEFSLDVDEVLRVSSDLDFFNSRLDEIASGQEFQDSILTATFNAPHYETATAEDVFLNDYGNPRTEYGLNLPADQSSDPNSLPNRSAAAVASTAQVPKPISLSGTVYVDNNLNLKREASEQVLTGVKVALWKRDPVSGGFVDTGLVTNTDALGRYRFGTELGLMPGTYRVVQTQPDGYFSVGSIAGTVDGQPTGVSETADILSQIALPLGDLHAVDFDFAEAAPAIVGGFVYRDDNDNGIKNAGEPGLANVRVRLVPVETIGSQTELVTTTAADGSYRFENLSPGRYRIIEVDQPAPWTDGLDAAGTVDGTSSGTAINPGDAIHDVVLRGNSVGRDYNFGELPLGSLSGYVYLVPPGEDCFGDHADDHSTPLADVLVKLYDDAGKFVAETRTAADGSYRFANLPKGTYRLQEITPTGLLDGTGHAGSIGGVSVGDVVTDGSIHRIRLPAGKDGVRYDFCEAAPAQVSGYVYHDASNDGRRDPSETGIAGVTVRLVDSAGAIVATTKTAAGGRYEFKNILPGTYRIVEVTPEGYFDGLDRAGTIATVQIGAAENPGDAIGGVALRQGQTGIEYNFGELMPARIDGRVHADVDGDCILDPNEKTLAGVTIRLQDADGRELAQTKTDAQGRYFFDGLRPGQYTVVQDQPAGYFTGGQKAGTTGGDATLANRISEIRVGSAITSTGNDFCEHPPSELTGSVFADSDEDCIREAGEAGIEGVRIELLDASGKVVQTTTTDADGRYRFSGLPAGQYTVRETQPVGYLQGGQRAGSGGGDASQQDRITQIGIGWGERLVEYDFCELEPSAIQGLVFVDSDGDCIHEPAIGERPLSGVTIRLHDAEGTVIATTTTGADGRYRFDNLRPGEYRVSEIQPDGVFHGGQVVGSGGGVASRDLISQIEIGPGQSLVDYNFCELDPSSIEGMVFVDSNGDCVRDPALGERPLSGVTVRLHDADGKVLQTTTTDANGRYRFDNLPPGQYRVSEIQPDGVFHGGQTVGSGGGVASRDLISQIQVGPGQTLVDYNFCELDPSSIEGTVFVDSNGDCVQDPALGERPLSGVTVHLHDADGKVIQTTATDANGRYRFDNLPPGQYRVSEIQPDGVFHGGQTVGSGGGVASRDLISQIEIGPGQSLIDYNFCELDPSSIEGIVFVDSNGDCVRDPALGERPLSDVTVQLHDADGKVIQTTTTDANGRYRFDNLPPGQYRVSEIQPEGVFHGGQTVGTGGGVASRDLISQIQVGPGQTLVNYNFCELDPSSIEGVVFVDSDSDCIYDPELGERPLSDVTVRLHDAVGTVIATTSTDAEGRYKFANLPPGKYTISEVQPANYYQGGQRVGSGGGVASDDRISEIPLGPGQTLVNYDFCELPGSTLSGRVWTDLDLDQEQDAGEVSIAGVRIELVDETGRTVAETTTNQDGDYEFRDIPPGLYSVRETQPTGYFHGGQIAGSHGGDASAADRITAIKIPAGTKLIRYDFPEVPPAKISGYIFQDGPAIPSKDPLPPESLRQFRDGLRDTDDIPLAGVVVELRNLLGQPFDASRALPGVYADGPIRVVTGADGYYEFTGLRPGTYHVYEVQPEDYIDGLDTPGSTGGVADNAADVDGNPELQFVIQTLAANSDTDPRRDAILNVSLAAGGASVNNNFSEIILTDPPNIPPQEWLTPAPPVRPTAPIETFPTPDLLFGAAVPADIRPPMIGDWNTAVTWHLSVINGGFPRGEGIAEGAVLRQVGFADATQPWSQVEGNQGAWEYFDLEGNAIPRSSQMLTLGVVDAVPMVGDFNGDGRDDVAVFIAGQWLVDLSGDGSWDSGDLWIQLGTQLDRPVVGDWDGDGKDDVGIFGPQWNRDPEAIKNDPGLPDPDNVRRRGAKNTPPTESEAADGKRFLRRTSQGPMRADLIDHVFRYGRNPDSPLAGDWNGDGIDSIAVFRAGQWMLDSDGDGRWTKRDELIDFGLVGDLPIVGDWNGDGIDDLAVVRGDYWIIDSDGDRRLTAADARIRIPRGKNDVPIAGDWDGDGRSEPGLYRTTDKKPDIDRPAA